MAEAATAERVAPKVVEVGRRGAMLEAAMVEAVVGRRGAMLEAAMVEAGMGSWGAMLEAAVVEAGASSCRPSRQHRV